MFNLDKLTDKIQPLIDYQAKRSFLDIALKRYDSILGGKELHVEVLEKAALQAVTEAHILLSTVEKHYKNEKGR